MAIQTDWKLTPLLQYVKPNPQLLNQTSRGHNPGPGNVAASDVQQPLTNHPVNRKQSIPNMETNVPIVLHSPQPTPITIQQSPPQQSQTSIVPDHQLQNSGLPQTDNQSALPSVHNLSDNGPTNDPQTVTEKANTSNKSSHPDSLSVSSSPSLISSSPPFFLGQM